MGCRCGIRKILPHRWRQFPWDASTASARMIVAFPIGLYARASLLRRKNHSRFRYILLLCNGRQPFGPGEPKSARHEEGFLLHSTAPLRHNDPEA